jgi:8-oxo-dGTP pyrophosphatase MutT (NUDIX family)
MYNLSMQERKLQVGVKVLLRGPQGKYLFVRRNLELPQYAGMNNDWDIVGGRIDPGATLLENLKRETKEETNLNLTDTPELLGAQDIIKEGRHIVRLTYTASITGDPVLGDEHIEYKWLTPDEAITIPTLDRYVKELLRSGML